MARRPPLLLLTFFLSSCLLFVFVASDPFALNGSSSAATSWKNKHDARVATIARMKARRDARRRRVRGGRRHQQLTPEANQSPSRGKSAQMLAPTTNVEYMEVSMGSVYRTRDGKTYFVNSPVTIIREDPSPPPPPPPPPVSEAPTIVSPPPSNLTGHQLRVKQAKEFLSAHNNIRQQLNMPQLTWDRTLARFAHNWAANIVASQECSNPRHSNGLYGENAFWGSGPEWQPVDAVKAWADEYVNYNRNDNSCKPGGVCGHYTQMVWRTTQRLGCERINCLSGDTYITCNYDPPGNYVGETPFDLPH